MDKIKIVLQGNEKAANAQTTPNNTKQDDEPSFASQFDERCGLTRTQRLIGFGCCFSLGWLLNILSIFAIGSIVTNPAKFAVLYTVGNLISLSATGFLWGPIKQIKNMFAPIRVVATVVFICSMAATLGLAFGLKPPQAWPVVITMIIQLCAMIWYTLSYIPFGQEILKKMIGNVIGGGGQAA